MTLPIFYPIVDVELCRERSVAVPDAAEAIIQGGASLIQWRCKLPPGRRALAELEKVAARCQRSGVSLIVNDRCDIAIMFSAGVHIGQDDLPPATARRLMGPDATIGYSTHNRRQLGQAQDESVDYVAIGPIFATSTKANPDAAVGLANLSAWHGLAMQPLVAIGGITLETAGEVLEHGAVSIAVISDLMPPECSVRWIEQRSRTWSSSF